MGLSENGVCAADLNRKNEVLTIKSNALKRTKHNLTESFQKDSTLNQTRDLAKEHSRPLMFMVSPLGSNCSMTFALSRSQSAKKGSICGAAHDSDCFKGKSIETKKTWFLSSNKCHTFFSCIFLVDWQFQGWRVNLSLSVDMFLF